MFPFLIWDALKPCNLELWAPEFGFSVFSKFCSSVYEYNISFVFLEKPAKCHFKEDCLPLPNLQIFFYKLLDLLGSRAYIAACIEVVHLERWNVWEILENDGVNQV